MAVTRPLKEGSVTTYQQKVALGFPDILASEMDADLDTIYAAWNGGVGTANLVDGSVTTAKLAPNLQTWQTGAGNPITPIDATKTVTIPGVAGTTGGQLVLGTRTIKFRSLTDLSASDWAGWVLNNPWAPEVSAQSSWLCSLSSATTSADSFLLQRRAPGAASGAVTSLLTVQGGGDLVLGGANVVLGTRTIKGRLITFVPYDITALTCNDSATSGGSWVQDDAAKPSWHAVLSTANDWFNVERRAAGGAATVPLQSDAAGNLTISGGTATKASGTTWANPSDRRLKDDIADYSIGLAAIAQLQPRTFVYNGKGGSPAGLRGYGFIADEVAPVMPEMVGVRAGKLDPDDEEKTEIQTLDQSNLVLALVNAVKELAARVTALEAR